MNNLQICFSATTLAYKKNSFNHIVWLLMKTYRLLVFNNPRSSSTLILTEYFNSCNSICVFKHEYSFSICLLNDVFYHWLHVNFNVVDRVTIRSHCTGLRWDRNTGLNDSECFICLFIRIKKNLQKTCQSEQKSN